MSIKISVVIPTYKRPGLLLKCLGALMEQEFDPDKFEVIVVSDGPDEATKKIVDRSTQGKLMRVRFLHLPQKKGPAAARNFGWLNARAELVAFTDDDCLPDTGWLKAFYSNYIPGRDMAFSGKTIVPLPQKPTDYELNIASLQTADFITANCCCTKISLARTGGFDEQFSMAWREDSDLEFKLLREHIPIIKIDHAIVVHPVRKAKWGVSIKDQKKTMFNALLYKKYPDLYRERIQPKPPISYYATIIAFIIMLSGLLFGSHLFAVIGGMVWLLLTALFIFNRLRNTTLAFNHVIEMIFTSLIIPFLSIYWQLYGDFKYKVVLI